MRRSSKGAHKAATQPTVCRRRTTPDPGLGMPIELSGGERSALQSHCAACRRARRTPPATDRRSTNCGWLRANDNG